MLKFIQKTFLTFFLLGLLFSYSKAEETVLPEVMVGNTKVIYDPSGVNTTVYGGFSGSEAVFNHTNDTSTLTNPKPNVAPGQMMGASLGPSKAFSGLETTAASYVNFGSAPDFSGYGGFAISMWIKRSPDSDTTTNERLFTMSSTSDYQQQLALTIVKNDTRFPNSINLFLFGTNDGARPPSPGGDYQPNPGLNGFDLYSSSIPAYPQTKIQTQILPSDSTWHHIVAIRKDDGLNGELWIDNKLVAATEKTTYTCSFPYNFIDYNGDGDKSDLNLNEALNNKDYNNDGDKVDILNEYQTQQMTGSLCQIKLKATTTTPQSVITAIGKNVGFDGKTAERSFKGNIDEVRTYSRALTAEEIARLYSNTPSAMDNSTANGLKAYWKFDEKSGTTVYDSSGNNYIGTTYNTSFSTNGKFFPTVPPSDNYGYDLFGFDKTALANCVNGIILGTTPDRCFISNSYMANVAVMNSRTYLGDKPVSEMATLFYPPKPLIVGDAYLGTLDPNNFAYWGKNLVQNDANHSASTDSYWGVGAYSNALASDLATYKKKITAAQSEATVPYSFPTGGAGLWYLQGQDTSFGTESGNLDANKYPNGKIWKTTIGQIINNDITYSGKGTIIINGDLTVNSGVDILPPSTDSDSRLGIIVTGKVTMNGNNKIKATILSYGDFIINSNSTLTGSFVASDFTTLRANPVTITNTRLIYDTGLNKSWPPIFGELNMPHASEQ